MMVQHVCFDNLVLCFQWCKDMRIRGYEDTRIRGYEDTRICGYEEIAILPLRVGGTSAWPRFWLTYINGHIPHAHTYMSLSSDIGFSVVSGTRRIATDDRSHHWNPISHTPTILNCINISPHMMFNCCVNSCDKLMGRRICFPLLQYPIDVSS